MNREIVIDDVELRIKGIEVLNQALGPSAALRFLSLLHRENTDYVKISRSLYKDQTIAEIANRAKKLWKKR